MTSQLHKKHPTTQQNIHPQIPSRLRFVLPYVITGIAFVCLTTSIVAADKKPVANQQPSSQQLSPLDRLKKRSAQNRFDKFHSNWQREKKVETILPKPTPASAHIVEVIDVKSFNQSPQKKTGGTQSISFHHVLKRTELIKPIQQKREPVNYEVKPLEQEKMNTPRDLKKIKEILPYHDYNSEESSTRKQGELPKEIALSQKNYSERYFPDAFYHWHASNIGYQPLYFEDVQLERYGHEYPSYIQPFVSVTKFGTQLVGLPYQMGIDSPGKLVSPLGYYRPGEAAPKLHHQIPLSVKGAMLQVGTVTGLIFLIP